MEFWKDYEIEQCLDKGSESEVLVVRKRKDDSRLIVKSTDTSRTRERRCVKKQYNREIDIITAFDHPNIAMPVDIQFEDNHVMIMYPFYMGTTLGNLIKNDAVLTEKESLVITRQLLEALAYVHNRGIVHADISPNNIFITEKNGLKLLDFGYSLTEEEARKIAEGNIIGTFPYLSPEQMGFTGFKIDCRSDLYCVSILLYRMLAGRLPFTMNDSNIKELLDASIKRNIPVLKGSSRNLNEIVLKGLRPSPGDRYQTAEGYLFDINASIDMATGSSPAIPVGEKDTLFSVNRKRHFIERESEMGALRSALGKLDEHEGRSILLYGKSGIGKTEIVREFLEQVDGGVYDIVTAKCNRFTPTQPYFVLRKLLVELYSIIEGRKPEERREHFEFIQRELAEYSGLVCSIVPELKHWFRLINSVGTIEKGKEVDRIIHVFSQVFRTLCKKRKMILFIDDIQWIDRITFEVMRKIVHQRMGCLVVCTFRTGGNDDELFYYSENMKDAGFSKVLKVTPFTRREVRRLVSLKFESLRDADTLTEVLINRTDGNPFIITEAIRYLVSNAYLGMSSDEWKLRPEHLALLPEKFDMFSLIMVKFNSLSGQERNVLQIASVIEGRFGAAVISEVNNRKIGENERILATLESCGFIKTQLRGGYAFTHDRIQESIAERIPAEEKCGINEKLAGYFMNLSSKDAEYIFAAAEYYLKSRNYLQAINACRRAAEFATEKNALDIAIKYFKNTLVICKFGESEGVRPEIDLAEITIRYGRVLMMTGANTQALNVYNGVVRNPSLSELQKLEVKYNIGSIYHNLGQFEKSTPHFLEMIREMGVSVPRGVNRIKLAVIFEIAVQALHSIGLRRLFRKRNDTYSLIKSRVLFKLSYSLYFNDMNLCFLINFKSLNLADHLDDCYEKSEVYASHQIPSYQMMLKRRTFRFAGRAIRIAEKVQRPDNIAFAESFAGLTRYYNAEWKKSEELLEGSIGRYRSLGDLNNQIISAEHLWKIKLIKGCLREANEEMLKTIDLCRKVNEQYYLVVTVAALQLVELLRSGEYDPARDEEIESKMKTVDSVLLQIDAGAYLLNKEMELGNFQKAYDAASTLLPLILKKCINSEYQVRNFSLFCSLICKELRNRRKNQAKIAIPDRKLKWDFIQNCFIHMFSCLSYPAYWGMFFRNIAWFFAVHNFHRIAGFFFRKAIREHHRLDMRYEEACSIRDYGQFLEECRNRPGEGRDCYREAYELFEWCGAGLETSRLSAYVNRVKKEGPPVPAFRDDEAYGTRIEDSSSGVNLLRFETLLDVSKTITETDEPSILLKQILSAMIVATGAQYGCLFINRNVYSGYEPFGMSFEGKEVPVAEVPVFRDLINKVDEIHTLQCTGETELGGETETDSAFIRSDLCIPLNWREKYLGYVYLVNDRVQGLFGEGAQKAALILASHAGILLENAQLMSKQKKFNEELQAQVRSQTNDILTKNQQLETANLKLIESERMKGILSDTVVHDIKNYAAGITGNLTVLQRRFEQDAKAQRILDVVSETCSDIASLASNLLDIAKMDEGKMVVREEPLGYPFFEAMAEKFGKGALFDEKGIAPKIFPPDEDFRISADVYLMERLVQNLYNNAAKYAPKGSSVELRFQTGEKEVVISFFSSGTPIPDDEKQILFEKYARLQNRYSHYSKGLGLFFCRMVMQAHGGRIWLDTDISGNYFKLCFPRKDPVARLSAAS